MQTDKELICEFMVPGKPVGKQRPRFNRFQKRAYTPAKTKSFEQNIKLRAKLSMGSKMPLENIGVHMELEIYLEIPSTWPKWKKESAAEGMVGGTKKPDIDNVIKAICDGCNEIVYKDDALVMSCQTVKSYSLIPRCVVRFSKLNLITAHTKTKQEAYNV